MVVKDSMIKVTIKLGLYFSMFLMEQPKLDELADDDFVFLVQKELSGKSVLHHPRHPVGCGS